MSDAALSTVLHRYIIPRKSMEIVDAQMQMHNETELSSAFLLGDLFD